MRGPKNTISIEKNKLKNNGIKISPIGIKTLNFSSKLRELVIQYKLEIKYPKPKVHPILKDKIFSLE